MLLFAAMNRFIGKPMRFAYKSSRKVAKVSASEPQQRSVTNLLPCSSQPVHMHKIIETSAAGSCDIDRVGTCQFHMSVKLLVHKGGLDQCLTVVKCPVDFNRRYIPSQCRELRLLYMTHLSFRIKHVNVYAIHSEKAVGHCAAGIARCGHKHIDRAFV